MCCASALFHLRYKKGARGKSPDSRNRLKRLKLFSNDIYTIDVIFCELRLDLVDGLLAAAFHCDVLRVLQLLNMLPMSATLLVFQPLKSRVVRDSQPWNIRDMLVTWLVSKPLKSRDVRDSQQVNMPSMLVTQPVSHPFKFNSDRLRQHVNMCLISVTLLVSRLSKSKEKSLFIQENILCIEVIFSNFDTGRLQ